MDESMNIKKSLWLFGRKYNIPQNDKESHRHPKLSFIIVVSTF